MKKKMKFGNYNLTTATENQRHLFIFRIKKVKSTANYIVGKFHNKFGTIAMLQQPSQNHRNRQGLLRSESPLSYRASLFDEFQYNGEKNGDYKKFCPDDFPKTWLDAGGEGFYVFGKGQNLHKNKTISGKRKFLNINVANPYHSLKSSFSKTSTNSMVGSYRKKEYDAEDDLPKSTIAQLLEKQNDEDTEMQILQDYFDTMSYTDIIKDKHFKKYLIKKEYIDIIDYIYNHSVKSNLGELSSDSEKNSIMSNNDCDSVKKEKLGVDFNKKYYSNSNPQVYCKRNRSFQRYYQNRSPHTWSDRTSSWYRKQNIPSYVTLPKTPKKYKQIIDYCERSLTRHKSGTINELKLKKMTKSSYSEKNYYKIIDDFVKKRGFETPENYVEYYYGDFLRKKSFKLKRRKLPTTTTMTSNNNNNNQQFSSLPPPPYSSGNFNKDANNDSKFSSLLYADSFKNYEFLQEGDTKKNKTSSTSCTHLNRPIFQPVDDEGNDIIATEEVSKVNLSKFCFKANHVYLDDFILHGKQPKKLPSDDIYETIRSINPNYTHKSLPNFKINGECCNKSNIVINSASGNPADMVSRGYRDEMQSEEMSSLVPPGLQDKADILFGNLHELYSFHSETFLKDLENCISTTELVALCFVQRRDTFFRLYSYYCQNIPRSERLRETLVDTHLFLQECQKKLGHKLPLAAYLLKPVQRITKYQLLLKDLLRFSDTGTCSRELQKALDCMLVVLKCVNDSMHQIAITGFPADLSQQGELLLQDSFQIWTESKKDMRLRLKAQQRHIFLYQKALLFCKHGSKAAGHNKSTYQFKHWLQMSQIGLTENVRGDSRRFEVWLQGRQEVHTIQANTLDIKNKWVSEIKRVLLNQLEELKGEKIKQYGGVNHKPLKHAASWDMPQSLHSITNRALSQDIMRIPNVNEDMISATGISSSSSEHDNQETNAWSSDYSNSEDEFSHLEENIIPGTKYKSLADYCAMGHSEVSMKEGDIVELLKVGCAGWWFVNVISNNHEGWAPAAYLEPINRKSSRMRAKSQDRLNDH